MRTLRPGWLAAKPLRFAGPLRVALRHAPAVLRTRAGSGPLLVEHNNDIDINFVSGAHEMNYGSLLSFEARRDGHLAGDETQTLLGLLLRRLASFGKH